MRISRTAILAHGAAFASACAVIVRYGPTTTHQATIHCFLALALGTVACMAIGSLLIKEGVRRSVGPPSRIPALVAVAGLAILFLAMPLGGAATGFSVIAVGQQVRAAFQ